MLAMGRNVLIENMVSGSVAYGSQMFLLLGTLLVVPIVITYTAWTYWVFRGKVRAGEGYH